MTTTQNHQQISAAMSLPGAFYEADGIIGIGTGDVDDVGTDSEVHYLTDAVRFDHLYNVVERFPRYGVLTSHAVEGLDCPNLTAYAELLGEDAHHARIAHEDAAAVLDRAEKIASAATALAYYGEG